MTMDLISGLAVTTSIFMLSCAMVAVLAARSRSESDRAIIPEAHAFASRILATLVVVFFIATADLLLIAQQVSLALGTFVVGILLVVVLYLEPSLRQSKRETPGGEGKEDWRR